MTVCPETSRIFRDRMVTRWYCRCHGTRSAASRQPRSAATQTLARLYARQGVIAVMKAYRELGWTLTDAKRDFDSLRGKGKWEPRVPRSQRHLALAIGMQVHKEIQEAVRKRGGAA